MKSFATTTKGFTILEALVSTFILTLVFVGFAGSMSAMNTDLKKVQMQASRGDVSRLIRMNLNNRASLANSAEFDSGLNTCLNANAAGGCTSFKQYEFNLYSSLKDQQVIDPITSLPKVDAAGNPVLAADTIGGISGTTCATKDSAQTSVFYTVNGQHCKCSDPAANCPFQVITKYAPICASGATCSKPAAIKVFYNIKIRPDLPSDIVAKLPLREENSDQLIDLSTDDDYFVKFVSARSYDISAATGAKTINQAVTESDIRQGKGLSYGTPGYFEFEVNTVSPDLTTSIQLYRYVYPDTCNLTNVGTGICTLPQASDYTALPAMTFPGTKGATVTVTDTVATGRLMDYHVRSYNAAGIVLFDSKVDLRAYFKDTGTLSVVPPASLVFTCDSKNPLNTFAFQAKSVSGWKSLTHSISPTLNYAGVSYTTIPGVTIDPMSTAVQNFVVDPKYFAPGVTYTVTFQGETNEGVLKKDVESFTSATKPAQSLTLVSPAASSSVRTKNDLTVQMDVNLACGDTVNKMTFGIKTASTAATVYPVKDLVATCAPLPGAPDENKFRCSKTMACTEWLNVADVPSCETRFAVDTSLIATSVLTSSSGFTQTKANTFTAGAKISISLAQYYVQWIVNNTITSPGDMLPKLTVASVPIQVNLSSALNAGESIHITLKGANTDATFTCGNPTSSPGVSYSSKVCNIPMPTPNPVKGDVITLGSPDPNVDILSPSSIVFLELNETQMDCNNIVNRPSCLPGTTLKRKTTTLGAYNLNYGDGTFNLSSYSASKPDSAIDFFISYIPKSSSSKGSFTIVLERVIGTNPDGSIDSIKSQFVTNSADMKVCTTSGGCPGSLVQLDGSYFASRAANFPYGKSFGITLSNNFTSNATQEIGIIRECYCAP